MTSPLKTARAVVDAMLAYADSSACDRFDPTLDSACVCASVLLGLALRHQGVRCWLICGRWRGSVVHWWVSTNAELLDITRQQLGFKRHVARLKLWHKDYENADAKPVYLDGSGSWKMQLPEARRHPSHPCHRHAFMVSALAEVTGMPRNEAERQLTEFIGPPATADENVSMMRFGVQHEEPWKDAA